jgi:hypothetical protein
MNWLVSPESNAGMQMIGICLIVICCSQACFVDCFGNECASNCIGGFSCPYPSGYGCGAYISPQQ